MDQELLKFLKSKHFIISVVEDSPTTATVRVQCSFCTKLTDIQLPMDGLNLWAHGSYIQNALRSLNPDKREQLISGVCPTCWSKTFPEE